MFLNFFESLRDANVPVTVKEYLTLMEAMDADVVHGQVEDFYYLARASLIKDERHIDRFDQVFGHVFKGLESLSEGANLEAEIPEEWLRRMSELYLSDEEKKRIEELGGWEKIMEELQKRLKEQQGRHEGGNKWIGTGGTSPFGAYGYNPAGIRIGQHESRHRRAIKVWDKREFKDLAGDVELGVRNIKMALRRLRKFAREGAADELDLDETISGTAQKGYLDIRMRPERRNAVKMLMFFDVGGSMDWHVQMAEELFSAARTEFKHLRYVYFHNCLYENVWTNNVRRRTELISTWDVFNTYPTDYKVILVGDASMSPYEITHIGGAVEHMNPEAGATWLTRLTERFPHCVWINPVPQDQWRWTPSIEIIRRLMDGRMFPMTVDGLDEAMRELMT